VESFAAIAPETLHRSAGNHGRHLFGESYLPEATSRTPHTSKPADNIPDVPAARTAKLVREGGGRSLRYMNT
jgi:hypothetical protein